VLGQRAGGASEDGGPRYVACSEQVSAWRARRARPWSERARFGSSTKAALPKDAGKGGSRAICAMRRHSSRHGLTDCCLPRTARCSPMHFVWLPQPPTLIPTRWP